MKSKTERSSIVKNATLASEKEAILNGASLALIRPVNVRFRWKRRSKSELEKAKQNFESKAKQSSFLDKELAAFEPCPFKFTMSYDDADGPHNKECGDWETSAAFYNLSKQYEEADVLKHLETTYVEKYVETGLVFALGNMAKRPQTWQLLGIFPCTETQQDSLF